eukprot:gnl/TRDRNA2_/TRDRNA2_174100_c0_seq11.p1 gnl/TRDRNA2_/TRDRNA2_174100_c0~~gnl/TRDRNA2_/TRDRNA2_174100_c0_seq11.p1  ORF type:complete len:107 (+),score=8.30 gnl/TRDRNA2_/TRDRNA2_174100_c0_seq11:625-945(+)
MIVLAHARELNLIASSSGQRNPKRPCTAVTQSQRPCKETEIAYQPSQASILERTHCTGTFVEAAEIPSRQVEEYCSRLHSAIAMIASIFEACMGSSRLHRTNRRCL